LKIQGGKDWTYYIFLIVTAQVLSSAVRVSGSKAALARQPGSTHLSLAM
jgi:hypothetical protein